MAHGQYVIKISSLLVKNVSLRPLRKHNTENIKRNKQKKPCLPEIYSVILMDNCLNNGQTIYHALFVSDICENIPQICENLPGRYTNTQS